MSKIFDKFEKIGQKLHKFGKSGFQKCAVDA